MTEEECRMITNASSAMGTPIPLMPLAGTKEALSNWDKRMKYPDRLYPALPSSPVQRYGCLCKFSLTSSLATNWLLSIQLRTNAPNESEWGNLITCHLEGDASQVLHAAEKAAVKSCFGQKPVLYS
jgi:hypothetical protein